MKKFYTVFMVALMMSVSADAQLISMLAGAIKKAVPIYTPGAITYKDGHEVEFAWVELPKSGDVTLKVSNDPKHKKTEEISAADVAHITYWTAQFPENKLTLFPLHADKSNVPMTGMLPVDVWGYPIAASPWGIVFKCHPAYEVNKKKGDLLLTYSERAVQMGNMIHYEEVAACCYLVCKDFDNAQLIGGSHSYDGLTMRWVTPKMKHIAPIFASNPALQQRIEEKQLQGGDIQYILDEMAIYHGMKDNAEAAPAEKQNSEATTNGTLGDDE